MKLTTITLMQAILALIIVFTNAILQTMSMLSLNKAINAQNDNTDGTQTTTDLNQAKKLLFASIVTQFIASLLLIIVTIIIIVYREKFQKHMSKFIYLALIIGILLMLTGSSLGAAAAFKMQCYRTDANVNTAWQQAMLTVLLGIVGTMLTLLIHAFVRRADIKGYLRTALTTKRITVPTHVPIEEKPKIQPPTQPKVAGPEPTLSVKPIESATIQQRQPVVLPTQRQRTPRAGIPTRQASFRPGLGTGFQPPLSQPVRRSSFRT